MTIAGIIQNGHGKAGSKGAWQVVQRASGKLELIHHQTLMLAWWKLDSGPSVTFMSTGHGSVSDQGGMNTAFRTLGLPFYFSRKEGATIIDTRTRQEAWL